MQKRKECQAPEPPGHLAKLALNNRPRLVPGGLLVMEFGYGQEDVMRAAAAAAGLRVERVLEDLQGIARTLVATLAT